MEQWPETSILPSQREVEKHYHHQRPLRILGVTSGNAQTYRQEFKVGFEDQVSVQEEASLKVSGPAGGHYHFPPAPTLPSNDPRAANLTRLHARRQKKGHGRGLRRRNDEVRPYLLCQKYIDYRARRRQDTGEDGKPVWDDPLEEAFQNALVAIKPMGRKKKSQNGKPHGRNELITEWIFHETGEQRTRKQVSSHIQVLNQLLKGIPEWDALVHVPPDNEIHLGSMEYFGNSIEQAVNSRKHFQQHGHGHVGHQYIDPAYGTFEKHQISKLSFEMWVSLPEKMEEALHNYTRLQSNRSTSEPIVLESIKNWRSMYPRLDEIINHWTPSERCDVIMLDASFQLLSDFPPKGSKLGISLELDFVDPSNSNYKVLEDLQVWEGCTTIYNRGSKVREAYYNGCHCASTGKVKPFFESKYWATTFTDLTEKRRRAEDKKDDAAVEAANEWSRSYLKHLTVIQEIYARPTRSPEMPRKRMAILLWKFSQAPPHWPIGITSWQRLLPPPDRLATNSPPPTQEMAFPPFAMDTLLDMAGNANVFDTYNDWDHFDTHQTFASFGHDFDEELCQNGTMVTRHSPDTANQLAAMQASFNMETTQGLVSQDIHNMHGYSFDLSLHDSQYHHESHATPGNFFATEPLHEAPADPGSQSQQYGDIPKEDSLDSPSRSQHPLNRFDANTHKLLQAQLNHSNEHMGNESSGIDDEALRQALVATSAMNDLGNQPHGEAHREDNVNGQQHSWTVPSASLTRSQLSSHASFAGQPSHACNQQQQYGPLQEISCNMAGFNANQLVTALSAHNAHQTTAAPTQKDQYQSTGNIQSLASFHLNDDQSQPQYSRLGGSIVEENDEM